jgi:hypothetical protein
MLQRKAGQTVWGSRSNCSGPGDVAPASASAAFAPEAHIRSKIWKTGSALFRLQTPTLCALEDVHNE